MQVNQSYDALSFLSDEELHQLLVEWNETEHWSASCLHEAFQVQAEQTPEAIAVVYERERLTYRELNERANQLARQLLQAGVGAETLVGICLERSLEMIVALLAVFKAGGAYVPFDPEYPPQRLSLMAEDSGIKALVTQQHLHETLFPDQRLVICTDRDAELISQQSKTNLPSFTGPDNLAYVIYTSGSTGTPKGVLVTHRNVSRLFAATEQWFDFKPADVWTMFHSFSFDFSVWEIWGALLYGGTLVVVPYWVSRSPEAFHDLLVAAGVTMLSQTPSAFRQLLSVDEQRASDAAAPTNGDGLQLRTVVFGGEALAVGRLLPWLERHGAERPRLVNMYGITETTVHVTYRQLNLDDARLNHGSPIGERIKDLDVYVLDERMAVVPVSVVGELYVGGEGLARGYLRRPELTAERFVPHPYSSRPGARLYRTGDLVRWLPTGELEYIGRADEQVKIRGFRVELGEIEATLASHPGVKAAVVLAREDDGEKQLVAYVVSATAEPALTVSEMRAHLRVKLPDYMVPASLVVLEELPLTPHGKVDRRALPAPDGLRPVLAHEYVAPRNATEEIVAGIWMEVLKVDRVGIHDNFFELGGHSLLATQVVSRLRLAFQRELPLQRLFEFPILLDLAAYIDAAKGEDTGAIAPPIVAVSRDRTLPLSFAQQRLWFLDQFLPGNALYNIPAALRLTGELNVAALAETISAIVARHEALRTTFPDREGQPEQSIAAAHPLTLPLLDLSEKPESEREAEAYRLVAEEAERPFNLATGPLFRASLLRLATAEHVLMFTMHHIISDGWSVGILISELSALYEARARGESLELPAPAVQYADFAVWQREWLQGDVLESQLAYWREQLAGAATALELPTDHARPPAQTYQGTHQVFLFSADVAKRLRELSREQGVTLFMTLLAAWQALLYRLSRQSDISVGSPIAGRTRLETEGLIGFFVNTLVLRTKVRGEERFTELLGRVREVCLGAYEHQDVPFEMLVDALQQDRNLSRSPLFQVMMVLQNAPAGELELPGLRLGGMEVESSSAKFDLTLNMVDTEQGLIARVSYSTDLFEAATIQRLCEQFERVLEAVAAAPERRIWELPVIDEDEQRQLLQDWNRTEAEYPREKSIPELFVAQVERTPDAVAVEHGAEKLTYRELNERANQLAHHLRSLGARPEMRVGISVERSFEMLIGVLGILKSGAAYLPLDPEYPAERLAFMLEDAQVTLLLTQRHLAGRLPTQQTDQQTGQQTDQPTQIVYLDSDWANLDTAASQSTENPPLALTPANLCYVIYTSGSTGRPKGIAMTHGALVNLISWQCSHPVLSQGKRRLQFASLSFDASFREIFSILCSGGTLLLIPEELRRDLAQLARFIADERVEKILMPAVALRRLAEEFCQQSTLPAGLPAALREVIAAGEQLYVTPQIQRFFGQLENCRLHNHYGPSETHVVTALELDGAPEQWPTLPSIGRPIANTKVYLLDSFGQPVPLGVTGEIYLGGAGVARGYLNRPDLTAERFLPDPFGGMGDRLYRTGDLARYRADGAIEFIGRADEQVKIRGYRVELGEIEAVIGAHESVKETAVLAREDRSGERRLVAYVVAEDAAEPLPVAEIRGHLRERLPEYMVPVAFVVLEKLPLTPNNKIDRAALPAPDSARPELEREYVAPRNANEEILAGIWTEILGVAQVGVHDNFFELGGHSLLATQVMSKVRQSFSVDVPLRALFEHPTVAGLTEQIAQAQREAEALPTLPLTRVSRAEPLPLSFAQQRLWFLDQLESGTAVYNLPAAARLKGQLNIAALENALSEIIRRHEALRTTFPTVDSGPIQQIAAAAPVSLPITDLSNEVEVEKREADARRLIWEEAERPFDLVTGPLFRTSLLRLAADEHVLLLSMHHIISDGWSIGVLLSELAALYQAGVRGIALPLPELPVQYADFAVWQREWLQGEVRERQLSYWRRQLAGAATVLELPADHRRPAVQSFRGGRELMFVSAPVTQRLKELSREQRVTLFMTLLAAWQALLYRLSGQVDISVGTAIANRNRAETEGLIGFFVNTLVLRTEVRGEERFRDLLGRVREVCLGAYGHQDLPFEMLVEAMEPQRALSHSPLFQVMFMLQNASAGELELEGLSLSSIETEDRNATAKFDITLNMIDGPNGLFGTWEYSTDLYEADTIKRMASHFENLLTAVVENPDESVSALRLLDESEESRMQQEWRGSRSAFDASSCLQQFFERQAERSPDRIALQFRDQSFSYRQLNESANQLAHLLIARGVQAETLVGICLKRTPRMIMSMLAVLKAGGAYVPLDPAYPAQRLAAMAADAGLAFVITDSASQGRLETLPPSADEPASVDEASPADEASSADETSPANAASFASDLLSVELLCLDQEWDQRVATQSTDTPPCPATSANLAYVIYTSGSTGRAKGVAIAHRSAAALLHWAQLCYPPEDFTGVLASTSICFDLSIFEIFVTLGSGGRVILAETALELLAMSEAAKSEVRLINTVPSAMAELVRMGGVSESLKVVNLAGEALARDLVERVYEAGAVERVMNLYGPTEATTYSTYADVAAGADVNIGRAVENTEVFVLDGGMRMVPVGVVGELYIGGEGLARGYLHRAELTAEKFVPHPYGRTAGERLYRTGDMARWLKTGALEYLGRADQQVKVRGYRIELGEIETALISHAGVQDAVVLAREDEAGEKRLVAYVVPSGDGPELTISEMRGYLREKLPAYMIPSALVVLAELPLTPNGKVDRRALPAPAGTRPELERPYVAPRDATEEIVAAIWIELLGVSQVGVHDNFFELGGHSLLATRVISKVREAFGREVPLRALFEEPTVAGLAQRIEDAQRAGTGLAAPPLVKVERTATLPLSFAQQRLWFLDRLLKNSSVYNISTVVRLTGALQIEALEQTLTEIVRRHEVLRTYFPTVDDEPVQVIAPAEKVELRQLDLSAVAEPEQEAELLRVVGREAAEPFNLATGPVLRACLLRLGTESHVLMLMTHHITVDGWSIGVLLRELTLLYKAYSAGEPSPLVELPIQYADYAVWQRSWLQGDVLEQQLAYWRRQLGGVLPPLEIPTDRPRPATQTHHGTRQTFMLPADLSERLKGLGRRHGATLYMVLLAAWQALLARYSGQEDVIVGADIANRNRGETEGLIGFFVNQLVLRTDLSGDPSFTELLGRVREVALGAYAHQDVPFEKLVEELQPVRDLSRTPMFQVKLTLQNVPTGGALELPGLTLSPLYFETTTAKFDLLLTLFEAGPELGGTLEYNTDLFDAATIARLLEHFGMVLEAVVDRPEQRLSELPLLSEAERVQLLNEWNRTGAEYPLDKRLHQLFEEQVARTPTAVAVVFAETQLTYSELNERANQLAHYLRGLGVGPETLVGICVERSLELVVGLLGILKAGAAYVPLDAAYPLKRLSFMLEDAQVPVLLTEDSLFEKLPSYWGHTVSLDGDWELIAGESRANPEVEIEPEHPAYVLYTSGSTGQPKGVVISHAAICNHMHWMHSTFPLDADDRVLQKTPISFDASVWEFYAPLMAGARLIVARPGGHQDRAYLLEAIKQHEVTILQVVPTLLRLLLEDAELAGCQSLKRVFCGGEALTPELQDTFNAFMTAELVNVYGPTEATIHASFAVCSDAEPPRSSIGRPINNARLYILDQQQRPVPRGMVGDLYVSGAGLARGYAHRPDLTAEKFVPHPFSEVPGERLYKTGDRARYLPDGQIEFLGRIDHQIKLRGFRIELGEIEAAVGAHPAVRQAIVMAREDTPGEQRLVAYLTKDDDTDLTAIELRRYLKEKLPEHMIPSAFVMLDELPLAPNGKVERRALPAPEAVAGDEDSFVAPRDAIELQLAEIWEEVLRVRAVGVRDNFFDLGGNSLLAVRLMAQIEKRFGQDLSLSTLFLGATIEGLAAVLRQQTGGVPWSHLVPLQLGTTRPFFVIHATGGNVFSYVELARQLGPDQVLYGLQAAGFDEREPLAEIEEMAAVYINEMRGVQPAGPYLLGGWSFGGVVAYEIARQLHEQGEEVALLALIDSHVPVASAYNYASDHAALVIMFARDLFGNLGDDVLATYTELQQRTPDEQLHYLLDQAVSAHVLPPETGVEQMRRLFKVYRANFLAREKYRPAPYAGRITLLRAGEAVEDHEQNHDLGWSDLAAAAVDVQFVPGSHYTMMRKPHVAALAEPLRAAIQQAQPPELVATSPAAGPQAVASE